MTTALDKPVRRLVKIRGVSYVLELNQAGIMFRVVRSKRRLVAPMFSVLELAKEWRDRDDRRDVLRTRALRRIGR